VLHGVVYERCERCDRLHYNTENAVENEYTVVRKELKQISVYGEMVSETTGYIKITGFEINTHEQFTRALIDLIDKGAVDFIFDVRDNPGGRLDSVMKVLSTILDYDKNAEKRALIRVLDKDGESSGEYIKLSEEYMDYYDIEEDDTRPSFSYYKNAAEEYEKLAGDMYKRAENEADELKKEEYLEKAKEYEKFAEFDYNLPKDAKVVVLTNENTASAGELFTEVLRVYGVSLTVGTKTYGKGSMQSYLYVSGTNDMSMGVLKITANAYTSPYSESYNGIGIEPDVKISLEGESALVSLWLLPKEDDAQYVYAYNTLNPNGQMEMPDENDYKLYD
jgi:C-terminal processing protease CtpA/Prc